MQISVNSVAEAATRLAPFATAKGKEDHATFHIVT